MQANDNYSRSRAPMRMRQARRMFRLAKKEGTAHKSLRAFIRANLKNEHCAGKLLTVLGQ